MTLHIGIIGTGWFSRVHADIIKGMNGVKLQAVCGTSLSKAEHMAQDYEAKGYGHLKDMLDSERLDAVYICVPPMSHGEIELELIRRGIPFLVEKPLGLDAELPRRILEQVEATGILTSVGYHFRYAQTVDRLKAMVNTHKVGMALGKWMGSMPGVAWWRQQNGSGGQCIEQTTHVVDLLRYVAGEVDEVYALYGKRVKHELEPNVEVADVGTITLKMRSGLIANISNTCVLPGDSDISETGLSFYTNQGILDWSPQRLSVQASGIQTNYTANNQPYIQENEAFIHALRTGDKSLIRSDYADAFKTQQVTCAALESATRGMPVAVLTI
ncbi:Gfo/Idh/MocA family protein [Paenibacillus pini]|nr:Gfo/Idh/MocA family oxidoreductase [Paenibacillus pini]